MQPKLTSTKNEIVQRARRLHSAKQRRLTGLVLVEGPTLVEEAAAAGMEFVTIFAVEDDADQLRLAETAGGSVIVTSKRVLDHIATTATPRGPIAIVRRPDPATVSTVSDTLILSDIADPGNAGTMVRTATAFGFHVATVTGSVDLWSPKALRAGSGAQFSAPPRVVASLADIARVGFRTIGLVVSGGSDPELLTGASPVALVVGSEAHGLPEKLIKECDDLVTIPTIGSVESLNAATAASIAMWERARLRQ